MKSLSLPLSAGLLMLCLAASPQHATAQELTIDSGLNLTSRFIYRGLDLGSAPQIQPRLVLSNGNLEFGGWGSHPLADTPDAANYKEVKFWLNYTFDLNGLNLTTMVENHYDANTDLFDFDEATTSHVLQASARLAQTTDAPLDLTVGYTFFGGPANTVYTELGKSFSAGSLGMRAFVSGQYSDGPGFVDLGYNDKFVINQIGVSATRALVLTSETSFPLTVALITNPKTERIFFAATIGF